MEYFIWGHGIVYMVNLFSISQLSKQYKCATFIDCQSLFYNSHGQILNHLFKNDLTHLNKVASEKLAMYIFHEISKK